MQNLANNSASSIVWTILFEIWLLIQTAELFIAPISIRTCKKKKESKETTQKKGSCLKPLE